MKINNAIKRASCCSWCKHTDNNYGWRNRKSVRLGKRIVRKKFITYLNRMDYRQL